MRQENDFVRDRLVPFFIGLGLTLGFSVACAVVYGVSLAFVTAGGYSSAVYGSPFGAAFGLWISVPLWLLILAANIGFWLLTTWLLGKWGQEKYRACRQMRAEKQARQAVYEREAWFAEKQKQKAEAEQNRQEAEWEKEWNLMKKQEKESSSSAKPEKSGSAAEQTPGRDKKEMQ